MDRSARKRRNIVADLYEETNYPMEKFISPHQT